MSRTSEHWDWAEWKPYFVDVSRALEWYDALGDAELAGKWMAVGVSTPNDAAALTSQGLVPDGARNQLLAQLYKGLCQIRMNGEQLIEHLHIRLHQISQKAHGLPSKFWNVTPVIALDDICEVHSSRRLSLDDIDEWGRHGFTVFEMARWIRIGVNMTQASLWRVTDLTVPKSQWYAEMGFSPEDYIDHFDEPKMSDTALVEWRQSLIPMPEIRMWVLAGFPHPNEAVRWLVALKLTPQETARLFSDFGGNYVNVKQYLNSLREQSLPTEVFRHESITDDSADMTFAPPQVKEPSPRSGTDTFPSADQAWLDEILARARTVHQFLRKQPHWPATIDLRRGVNIELSQIGNSVRGQVRHGSHTRECTFSPLTWVIQSSCVTGVDRYVVGMSICWFIDCSIVVSKPLGAKEELFEIKSQNSPHGQTRTRYVPTLAYDRRQIELRSTSSRLVVRHQVSGHVRRLSKGRQPSQRARANAPKHIHLRPDETFVEPHFRGTENERIQLLVRLSNYSALGDALADL